MIPIDEVELHDVFDSETRTKQGTVLSIFYEKIPMRMGSYDLEVHGKNVKFYKDTRIDPGMVTIITHVSNNQNTYHDLNFKAGLPLVWPCSQQLEHMALS